MYGPTSMKFRALGSPSAARSSRTNDPRVLGVNKGVGMFRNTIPRISKSSVNVDYSRIEQLESSHNPVEGLGLTRTPTII